MASDPMQLFGLYLDMKRRKERSAQEQQMMEMRQNQMREGALARAIEVAASTGDSKLATGLLEASQGGMSRMQDWELVDATAKNARKKMKAKEEAAAAKAATPNDAAQTDFARGLAAQLEAPGDPLRNAVEGLRGLPPEMPPVIANQIARRGGSIAGENQRRMSDYTQRKILSTEEWIRGKGSTGTAGGKKPTDVQVNRSEDRKNAAQSAWEKFAASDMDWSEWIQGGAGAGSRTDVVAAMRHPEYAKMRAKSLKRPIGFTNVEAGGGSSASGATVAAESGEWIDLGNGVRARKKK